LQGWGGSLLLAFLPLRFNPEKNKSNVPLAGRTKSVTEKNYRRAGVGRGKKDRGSFSKYL
jgi:hypothetical protein